METLAREREAAREKHALEMEALRSKHQVGMELGELKIRQAREAAKQPKAKEKA
jgi:hypothetical protein